MTSTIKDSSVLSLEQKDWQPMAAAPSSPEERMSPSLTAGQVFREQSSITSLSPSPMDTSESAVPLLRSRTYLAFNVPDYGLIIAPENKQLCIRIKELKKLLRSMGMWERLGGRIEKTRSGLTCLVFIKNVREELLTLCLSHPQLAQFLQNQNFLPCFYRFDAARPNGPITSTKGLIERPESEFGYRKGLKIFASAANAFCTKMGTPDPVKCDLPLDRIRQSQVALLTEIFCGQDHKGLCIGESSREINPKKFLIDNMGILASLEIDTLYLAHLPYEFAQPLLDEYLHPDCNEMPLLLRQYLTTVDNGLPEEYNYTSLIRTAKKNGIRVSCLDTIHSLQVGDPEPARQNAQDPQRIAAGNFAGFHIVNHERGKGKFVLLLGLFRGATVQIGEKVVPGLADLLQIPLVCLRDDKTLDATNLKNLKFGNVHMKNIHLYCAAPPPQIRVTASPSSSSSSASSSPSSNSSSSPASSPVPMETEK